MFCYSHYVSSSPAKEDGVVSSAPTLQLLSPSELHWAELQSNIYLNTILNFVFVKVHSVIFHTLEVRKRCRSKNMVCIMYEDTETLS